MRRDFSYRYAERKDVPLILTFIKELADYEQMLAEVVADEATLESWLKNKIKSKSRRGISSSAFLI